MDLKWPPKTSVRIRRDIPVPPEQRVTGKLVGVRFKAIPDADVEVLEAQVADVDFGRMRLSSFSADRSTFLRCDFSGARIDAGNLGDWATIYTECNFEKADLSNAQPSFARFERCIFDEANLKGWHSSEAEFIECRFAGRLERVKFFGRPPRPVRNLPRDRNEFVGNDFRNATLIDTSFTYGIDLGAQLWPRDPIYVRVDRVHQRLSKVRGAVSMWPDGDEKRRALDWIRVYENEAKEQAEIFVRRDELLPDMPELRRTLWEMLAAAEPPSP